MLRTKGNAIKWTEENEDTVLFILLQSKSRTPFESRPCFEGLGLDSKLRTPRAIANDSSKLRNGLDKAKSSDLHSQEKKCILEPPWGSQVSRNQDRNWLSSRDATKLVAK